MQMYTVPPVQPQPQFQLQLQPQPQFQIQQPTAPNVPTQEEEDEREGLECFLYLFCYLQALWGVVCLCLPRPEAQSVASGIGAFLGLTHIVCGQAMGRLILGDKSGFVSKAFSLVRALQLSVAVFALAAAYFRDEEIYDQQMTYAHDNDAHENGRNDDNLDLLMTAYGYLEVWYTIICICGLLEAFGLYTCAATIEDAAARKRMPPQQQQGQSAQPMVMNGDAFGIRAGGMVPQGAMTMQQQQQAPVFQQQPRPMELEMVPQKTRSQAFITDNSRLQSPAPGLSYRLSKNLHDKDGGQTAAWGATVHGVRDEGWLRVGARYLPFSVDDKPVLLPVAPDDKMQAASPTSREVLERQLEQDQDVLGDKTLSMKHHEVNNNMWDLVRGQEFNYQSHEAQEPGMGAGGYAPRKSRPSLKEVMEDVNDGPPAIGHAARQARLQPSPRSTAGQEAMKDVHLGPRAGGHSVRQDAMRDVQSGPGLSRKKSVGFADVDAGRPRSNSVDSGFSRPSPPQEMF